MTARERAHELLEQIDRYVSCHGDVRPGISHDWVCDDVKYGGGMMSPEEYTAMWTPDKAWSDYANRYGKEQSAERLAERGGFSYWELIDHLKHEPKTWEPRKPAPTPDSDVGS